MNRHLHIDCFSGLSGDMVLGAMFDLGVPEEIVQRTLNSLGLPGRLSVERTVKGGFAAVKATVQTPHEHAHRHLRHIVEILDRGEMTPGARDLAKRMFVALAQAEAKCHGTTVEKVHFHEVGAVDSIFDFVGIAVAFDWLSPQRTTSRPVAVGSGFIDCEHGRMPVPAPATAELLAGVPLAGTDIEGELTTPTGAAFLKTVVDEYVPQPAMTIEKTGLGAGTRELAAQPNVLRLFLGSSGQKTTADRSQDVVWQLETNLDDVTGELIGYCLDRVFEAGALDAWTAPIQMKKNRPGCVLTVLCHEADVATIEGVVFGETGTLGIRRRQTVRSTLPRQTASVETQWGPVRVKIGRRGDDAVVSPEYEDCAKAARAAGVPLRIVYQQAVRRHNEQAETRQ